MTAIKEHKPTRFGLRSLFVVVGVGAVLSECARAATDLSSPLLGGMFCFCVGGMVAIVAYAVITTMLIIATRSNHVQHVGAIGAAVSGVLLWLICIIVPMHMYPPFCLIYAALALGLCTLIVRNSWKTVEGNSPKQTLQKLREVKAKVARKMAR